METEAISTTCDDAFIDFHTHILPQMDDGAPNTDTAVEMLRRLKRQNVKTVVLTPHFYTDRESLADFLSRRETAFQELMAAAEPLNMELLLGCEMYLTDYIFHYDNISSLCINSGNCLLTELPFSGRIGVTVFSRLARLMATFNIVPVIAHVERYPGLCGNPDRLQYLSDLGCMTQMNLESLQHGCLQRRRLLKAIEQRMIHIVGSDCHNLNSRPPEYQDEIRIIQKKLGDKFLDGLMDNAEKALCRFR
ncbi:MAG TPA: CpsB/CapC family capsule biosynthesis tyrosine phosphatase [Caproiciproducens sp.]|nr:CpsB/CapC family capsule biosynthesis tyrosine phosphatase [Caproiciproducens sp.]